MVLRHPVCRSRILAGKARAFCFSSRVGKRRGTGERRERDGPGKEERESDKERER